jgi:hypothetical protein
MSFLIGCALRVVVGGVAVTFPEALITNTAFTVTFPEALITITALRVVVGVAISIYRAWLSALAGDRNNHPGLCLVLHNPADPASIPSSLW